MLKSKIKTYRNVIKSDSYLTHLNRLMLSDNFGWRWIATTAGDDDNLDDNLNGTFYHNLIRCKEYCSEHTNVFMPLIYECIDLSGYKGYTIERARLGLILNRGKPIVHAPHVDYREPHKTILFYLNKSDGATFFYKEEMSLENGDPKRYEQYEVIGQNLFEQNSMVVFDGHTYHSSSAPIHHELRIALNINLISI